MVTGFPPIEDPEILGLPVPVASCRGAYASHVLEHLTLEEFHTALDTPGKLPAHYWMSDSLSLGQALERHGFARVRRCSCGDCEDPMFGLVEDINRFEHARAMEARA